MKNISRRFLDKYKSCAAAGLFVLLTVLKFMLPEHGAELRERVLRIIDRNDDYHEYVETVQTLGSRITDGCLGERLVEVFGRERGAASEQTPAPEPMALPHTAVRPVEDVADIAEQTASAAPEPTSAQTPEPTPIPPTEPTPAPVPEEEPAIPSEQSEAVSAFLQRQSEFDGYSIPANVRTDMPEIPFDYVSPVDGYDSSGFGYRVHPIQGVVKFHYGTDFAANSGDSVAAFADGYVYAAGENDSYGKYLILTHDGGFATLYAHLSDFVAHEGDMVSRGQTIGRVGQTGNATGPHLHFELFLNDVYINPEYYV